MIRRLALLALVFAGACRNKPPARIIAEAFHFGPVRPDEPPRVINAEIPFHYPAAMYAGRVQANVTLHLFVDRDGRPVVDSTRVEESSLHPALDSAAMRGARELRFIPAKLHGEPLPITVLFPVYFRHPEARPLSGDSILPKRGTAP